MRHNDGPRRAARPHLILNIVLASAMQTLSNWRHWLEFSTPQTEAVPVQERSRSYLGQENRYIASSEYCFCDLPNTHSTIGCEMIFACGLLNQAIIEQTVASLMHAGRKKHSLYWGRHKHGISCRKLSRRNGRRVISRTCRLQR